MKLLNGSYLQMEYFINLKIHIMEKSPHYYSRTRFGNATKVLW